MPGRRRSDSVERNLAEEPPDRRRSRRRRREADMEDNKDVVGGAAPPRRSPRNRRRRKRDRSPSEASGDRKRRSQRRRSSKEKHRSYRRKQRSEEEEEDGSSGGRRRRRKRRPRHRSYSSSSSSSSRTLSKRRTGVVSDDEESSAGRKRRDNSSNRDDTIGHYRGGKGSIVGDRFKIIREVGLGTFGRVVECLDLKRRKDARAFVALKIVRKIQRYHESALVEARIVKAVNRRGGRGVTHCVVLHDSFSFEGHYCMVFESMGPSLFDFLKRHDYRPFPMVCLQDFTVQLLEVLEFLHSFRLIHTDLKIENILLTNDREVMHRGQPVPESTRIKLIDFGGACYDSDKKSNIINTRQYRAPEVILGTGWSMPSDLWSLGCILMELYRGELLFATHDSVEHLALMERTIGSFPRRMIHIAKDTGSQKEVANQSFNSEGLHRMDLPKDNYSYVRNAPRLNRLIKKSGDDWFMDLIHRLLVIDPNDRNTAHECLQFLSRIGRCTVRFN